MKKTKTEGRSFNRAMLITLIFAMAINLLLLIFVILSFVAGLNYASGVFLFDKTGNTSINGLHRNLIGGQKDDHGCLIPAGYSWCEAKGKCLRTWEEPCAVSAEENTRQALQNYLENNISALAPIRNARGNKVVLTEANLLSYDKAFIGYNDGRDFYNAEIGFSLDDGFRLKDFIVKNKNGEESTLQKCQADADCSPVPSACHPKICINAKYAKDFTKPEACTMMFDTTAAYEDKDCGCSESGYCVNKNANK